WMTGGDEHLHFMADNFLVSWEGLSQGRYWTLLTSVFSHNMFLHIFINMFVLNSFGSLLEQVLGRWRFLAFYLIAGVVSSLSHCLLSQFVLHQPETAALGASGSIAGLVLVFSLIFPKEKILLMGIIPLPAIWGALAFVALDLWGLSAQAHGGGLPIGHGAHLGGAFAGVIYYVFFLRRRIRR
ncbi:MAG: rhomboid family intramembrane serine protease, partial [Bdellovibrionales bacterium]